MYSKIFLLSLLLVITAWLGFNFFDTKKVEGRWYTQQQVSLGKQVFLKNCASCHGQEAQKTIDWKKGGIINQ